MPNTYPNSRIQLRIDTEANWQSNHPTIEAGEICLSSDKKDFVVGTGTAWAQGNYWIANNPTVTSIRTTANNAASAASQAMSKANQALSTAQAAAQSAGRVVNLDFLKEKIEQEQAITINDEIFNSLRNSDVIGYDCSLVQANSFDIAITNPKDDANEVRFYFSTAAAIEVKGVFYTAAGGEGILVIGDPALFNGVDTIRIPAESTVELRLIDGRVLVYNVTCWSNE